MATAEEEALRKKQARRRPTGAPAHGNQTASTDVHPSKPRHQELLGELPSRGVSPAENVAVHSNDAGEKVVAVSLFPNGYLFFVVRL